MLTQWCLTLSPSGRCGPLPAALSGDGKTFRIWDIVVGRYVTGDMSLNKI